MSVSFSLTYYELTLRFIMFIIFLSAIRVWILLSKSSLVIFSKSTVFLICLWILLTSAQLWLLHIWSIIEKIVSSMLSLTIFYLYLLFLFVYLSKDSSNDSSLAGWLWGSKGHQNCQTVTFADDLNEDHMLLEKNVHSSNTPNF